MGLTAGLIDAAWYVFAACVLTGIGMDRFPKNVEKVMRKISGSLLIVVAFYLVALTVRSFF
jgi:threonine/homoserine/homoserine lactone efflux protein